LINAYRNNPQLASPRAVVREPDESMPQALSGYRPSLSATAQVWPAYSSTVSQTVGPIGAPSYPRTGLGFVTSDVGITASQSLYDGFQTANRVQQAESNTSAAREALRVAEDRSAECSHRLHGSAARQRLARTTAQRR